MNEIEKLKTENARYKEALLSIRVTYGNAARLIAAEALNPAPPEPVTLAGIIEALGPNRGDYLSPSIEIFADGSASINLKSGKTLAFTTVQQALDFCKEATDEN